MQRSEDQRRIISSLFIPAILVVIIWIVKITETVSGIDLSEFGLQPLKWKGLIGIVTAPLLHADFSHLLANTLPLFFLTALLFYFYRELAWTILILVWLFTGIWVWLFARGEGVHVGASGVVYGLAAFLFLSGIIRRETRLMAITLLIAFLYGGLVWGVFPQLFPNKPISWESHLMGLLSGTILAIWFRKSGPQRKVYEWENEDDEDENNDGSRNGDDYYTSSFTHPDIRNNPPEN